MSFFEVRNLSFGYYHKNYLFREFNFEAEKSEIVAITGDSGSGKTTLLKIFCNVIPTLIKGNYSGKIFIDGNDISQYSLPQISPMVSMLMQEPENQLLFPNVESELAFGAENLCISPVEIHKRIDETLKILNIENLRFADTSTLSFGQKKLVAFASIIPFSPDIFLLDEPSAGLSSENIETMINAVKHFSENDKLIFIADHLNEILQIADRKIELKNA